MIEALGIWRFALSDLFQKMKTAFSSPAPRAPRGRNTAAEKR